MAHDFREFSPSRRRRPSRDGGGSSHHSNTVDRSQSKQVTMISEYNLQKLALSGLLLPARSRVPETPQSSKTVHPAEDQISRNTSLWGTFRCGHVT